MRMRYAIPKGKDPIHKARPLVSYYAHPSAPLLRGAARMLWRILQDLHKIRACHSFSIFTCQEYVQKQKGKTFAPGTRLLLGDVKNMYTNISHDQLKVAIDWVLGLASAHLPTKQGMIASTKRIPTFTTRYGANTQGKTMLWDQYVHFTMHQLREVLLWDIEHIYFTVGDCIMQQCQGIPMGSPCSPALAVLLCTHLEHSFIHSKGVQWCDTHLTGYRYIDDLLLYCDDSQFDLQEVVDMYAQPLELEVEDHDNSMVPFLSTLNTLHADGSLHIAYYHKNHRRAQLGLPRLNNVTHFSSHVPPQRAHGLTMGACHRVVQNSTTKAAAWGAMCEVLREYMACGLSTGVAAGVLYDLPTIYDRYHSPSYRLTTVA